MSQFSGVQHNIWTAMLMGFKQHQDIRNKMLLLFKLEFDITVTLIKLVVIKGISFYALIYIFVPVLPVI